jgi:hypothetical protein
MLLGTFLMLAVFQSFYVAARYRLTSSETHAYGLSLTNCVRDVSSDLMGHSTKRDMDGNQRTKDSSEPIDATFLPKLSFQDSFTANSQLKWVSFLGEQNYCVFQANTCNPRFTRLPANSVQAGNSLIVWWLWRGASPKIEGWVSNDLPFAKEVQIPANAKGLIRTQISLDQNGNEVQLSQVINPDVTEIKFLYSDGKSSQSRWASTLQKDCPRAVAVHVKIMNRETEHWITIPVVERN